MPKKQISIPYKFKPRDYQMPILQAMDDGYKRGICIWHRRSGKDKTFWNLMVKKAWERLGNYYYYFPTMSLGRKAIWQGIDKGGMPFLDHVPREVIYSKRDDQMRIEFVHPDPAHKGKPGSAIQIVGTDRPEVVGPNPVGCVFSEYSLQDPRGWNYVRPILAENDGWALFNYTPRGRNHGYDLYQGNKNNPKWFTQILTVDDTHAISQEAIQDEKDSGMSEALARQEFYCNWEYGLEGAYYLEEIAKMRDDGRLCTVPIQDLRVHTAWDIGEDQTSIWFVQIDGQKINIIDYYEDSGKGLKFYVKLLQDRGYLYGTHLAPHDISHVEWGSDQTRIERASELGVEFDVVARMSIDDGIEACRALFPRCWIDEDRCKAGLQALMNYQRTYDEKLKTYAAKPLHNWASHGADAFRSLAVGINQIVTMPMSDRDIDVNVVHYSNHPQGWMV